MDLNYFSKKLKPYVCTTEVSLLIRYAGQDNLVKNLMEIINISYSLPTQLYTDILTVTVTELLFFKKGEKSHSIHLLEYPGKENVDMGVHCTTENYSFKAFLPLESNKVNKHSSSPPLTRL